ncbi:MAG: DCC1-like thiol-disulfide oxidoreductase family protein, partial [Desulfococcus multivorans]|nr:DCC1-like thiol-disulfide oxidoreductase family protein [Desulfococcus multivorans]
IDPEKALKALHVQDENRQTLSEIDAYVLLMKRVPILKLPAMIIGLPWIRQVLSRLYRWSVNRRLRRTGRT